MPTLGRMDEGRKRVLLIAAAILAARKLCQSESTRSTPAKPIEKPERPAPKDQQTSFNPDEFEMNDLGEKESPLGTAKKKKWGK